MAGDIDGNSVVDGNDANTIADAETNIANGQTIDPSVDLNGDDKLDFADRLVILYN